MHISFRTSDLTNNRNNSGRHVFMKKKIILSIIVLSAAVFTLYRAQERRNTESSFYESNQIKMKRILTLAGEYHQQDPYLLYLELFKQPAKRRYDPLFFVDFQSAISRKSEDLHHYYTAVRAFSDSEEKEQPLSRDEFEKANDFLILYDPHGNMLIYSKISDTYYSKPDGKSKNPTASNFADEK